MPPNPPSVNSLRASTVTPVVSFLIARRWLLLALMMLFTLIIGAAGLLRTSFDTSLEALLTKSDPYLDEFTLFNEEFPQQLDINVVLVPPEGSSAFDPLVLDGLASLQERYLELPNALRISTLLNYSLPSNRSDSSSGPMIVMTTPNYSHCKVRHSTISC